MYFDNYLTESIESDDSNEINLEDFIKKIKSKGLYGYNIFKHISEEELKKILEDDEYFTKKEKGKEAKLSEMVIPPKKEADEESDKEQPQQNKLSLAVRLGLKKETQNQTQDNDKSSDHVFGKPNTTASVSEKPKPLSFADRMKAENERRQAERAEQQKRDQEIRDQKLKQAEDEGNKVNVTFADKSMDDQKQQDNKTIDTTNDKLDKQLTNSMFKKKPAAKISTDNNGYKKVDNIAQVDDKNSNNNLKKEMDDKFPEEDKNKKLGNSDQPVKRQTSTEYSKRTLLAIADRMDFDVYCKFKKANGQVRTGNFRIGKTDAQVTQKQDTIIVRDLDLDDWRTIPLNRIISIKPI